METLERLKNHLYGICLDQVMMVPTGFWYRVDDDNWGQIHVNEDGSFTIDPKRADEKTETIRFTHTVMRTKRLEFYNNDEVVWQIYR